MNALIAILLGILQGIAEFLPISGSGHLSVLQNFLPLDFSESQFFLLKTFLYMGTLLAVVVYYGRELQEMRLQSLAFLKGEEGGKTATGRFSPKVRCAFYLLIASVPLLLALFFYSRVEALFYSPLFVSLGFLVSGGLLYCIGKLPAGTKGEKRFTVADTLLIGLSQVLAFLPGLSRVGTTVTVAIARGLKNDFAIRFSYLLSVPALLGYILINLVKSLIGGMPWSVLPLGLLGMLFSFIVGFFVMQIVNKMVRHGSFPRFCYYCWMIGLITFILSLVL